MNHTVIITGGHLNIEFAEEYLKTLSYDKVFAVDKGLEYVEKLQIVPDYIVGDFDSVQEQVLHKYQSAMKQCQMDIYPVKKDATDTELAVRKAMEHSNQITILGATGSRIDHMLGNMDLLLQAVRNQCLCYIVDETNRIQILHSEYRKKCSIPKDNQFGKYLSVIPITESITGVSMTGVEYPLENVVINKGYTLTISNVIIEANANISIEDGILYVIESKDI